MAEAIASSAAAGCLHTVLPIVRLQKPSFVAAEKGAEQGIAFLSTVRKKMPSISTMLEIPKLAAKRTS